MINTIVFNSVAIFLIIFIIVWFWVLTNKSSKINTDEIIVQVKDGVYSPGRIETEHKNIKLIFIREDASPCSEFVLFDTLNIHEQLPLNKPHAIYLKNLEAGRYKFTCQMGMYQGVLTVK